MDLEAVNREVKHQFEEKRAGTSVEALLETNKYPRIKEEFACLERFLLTNNLILEAGCGLGPKLIYFDNKNYKILGVDYIFPVLQQIKNYNRRLILTQSDVHELPFPESTFGAYLSYGVIQHFSQGPQGAITEAYRVLKTGGLIFITVPTTNLVTNFVYNENNFPTSCKGIA